MKKEYNKASKCPDCGADLKSYHGNGGTRIVCIKKCKGYKVISSRGYGETEFHDGDL